MGRNINTNIYMSDYIPVLIEQRNVNAFYYFQRFVETLHSKIENVIVVEKIGNWDEREVQIFSGIVIVSKAVGRIAYIIEECSFSYEGRPTYRDVLDFLERLSIKKIVVQTDDEPIVDNMDYILTEVDKIIYG